MNDEQIRSLLFGSRADKVRVKSIALYRKNGQLPESYDDESVARWRCSFVGDYLANYPDRSYIIKYMTEAIGCIPQISDFTEANLHAIIERLQQYAPNTAKQRCSEIKSSINRVLESDENEQQIPCRRFAKILSLDGTPTTKTYMSIQDVKRFLRYKPKTEIERVCHARFCVMMMTGARHSDVKTFTPSNINDGILTYVPQKTKSSGTVVTIPVSEQTARFIEVLSQTKRDYQTGIFNATIREICRKCGLNEEVTYFWGGKYVTKPKWEAMRSHLGRASFVTNMLKNGMQIHDVSKMAGHTDIAMTSRYNASTDVKLTKEANDFLNMKF